MKPIAVKSPAKNVIGGKRLNQTLKMGAKALGYVGDLALPAMFVAPQLAPALEAAKAGSLALSGLQKARQIAKYKRLV